MSKMMPKLWPETMPRNPNPPPHFIISLDALIFTF